MAHCSCLVRVVWNLLEASPGTLLEVGGRDGDDGRGGQSPQDEDQQ